MKRLIKWLKSPWVISLGTAVFSLLLTIGYDFSKNKPVLSTIGSILTSVWGFILDVLNYQLRVWWLLLGLFVLFIIIYLLVKIDEIRNLESNESAFLKYTQDHIHGWKWSWVWGKQFDGKYGVENLHPICPDCGTPLCQNWDLAGRFVCPRCGYQSRTPFPNTDAVQIVIIDNAKRGLYSPKSIVNKDN